MSSKIFETGTFCGTKTLYIERSEAVACVLAHNQDFGTGRRIKPKVISVNWETYISKLLYLKCITDGGRGVEPPAAKGYGGLGAKPPASGKFFLIF